MKLSIGVFLIPTLLLADQAGTSLGTSAVVARGEKLFAQGCAVGYCHGSAGTAARSPRLRGRTFEKDYLVKVLRDGIPNTAMPAWGDRLTDDDINALVVYVQSLATASADGSAPSETASLAPPVAVKDPDLAADVRQGRELFHDPQRLQRCSNCHRLQGIGTPVGPDLAKLTRAQLAAEAVNALKYGRPRRVKGIVAKDGDRFPAILIERGPTETRLYDLKTPPPVQRNLPNSEIVSIQQQSGWRHSRAVQSYSTDELKSVWTFLRWVAEKK